ncbi:MAG: tetratricopeptide repeat protein [Myxococcales bacterium]|nr:tetratricopeptide repeat protein [Myxococcales bacterium]
MRTTLLTTLFFLSGCLPIRVPDAARAYNDECAVLFSRGDLEQAEVACAHALEYQPKYWDALHNLGLIRQARGDAKEARRLFREALRANPDMAQSYNSLGLLALEQNDFGSAKDWLRAALRVNPDYAEARANLGLACLKAGELDGAEQAYRHLTLSAPWLSEPYLRLGVIMLAKGRTPDAIKWLSRAVELEADYGPAWQALGVAYETEGRVEEARAAYESCVDSKQPAPECREGVERLTK